MVVQQLELGVSRRGPGVQSLVGELRSHELCSLGKKKKEEEEKKGKEFARSKPTCKDS